MLDLRLQPTAFDERIVSRSSQLQRWRELWCACNTQTLLLTNGPYINEIQGPLLSHGLYYTPRTHPHFKTFLCFKRKFAKVQALWKKTAMFSKESSVRLFAHVLEQDVKKSDEKWAFGDTEDCLSCIYTDKLHLFQLIQSPCRAVPSRSLLSILPFKACKIEGSLHDCEIKTFQ